MSSQSSPEQIEPPEGPVGASGGLERILSLQIQAFNQLVAQQLQMLERAAHPPKTELEPFAPAVPPPLSDRSDRSDRSVQSPVGSRERKGIEPAIAPVAAVDPDREVFFSLYFFGNSTAGLRAGKYDLNPDTCRLAGEMGAGVLTDLMGQTPEELAANLQVYREALARAGHPPSAGHVTLLLHTFLGPDAEQAVEAARGPFHRFLESSVGLVENAVAVEGMPVDFDRLGPDDREHMLELAYQRYVRTSALIGSPESVTPIVEHLRGLGVDEIACLVDFGIEPDLVRQSLPWIAALRQRFRAVWKSPAAETPDDEAYLLEAFSGELPVFEPPTDRPRPTVRTFRGDRRRGTLPPELDLRLREVTRKQGATFFIGLLAVWSALLHRWTGQDDVVIGGPAARRPLEGGDRLVGHCVDLVPYRSRISVDREPTFIEHVAALRRSVLAAHEHGGYPMARLLRRLALPHDPSRAPLINAVLNLDPGPAITHAKLDVALHVQEAGGEGAPARVDLYLDYLRDLFDPSTMDRLLGHLVTLIAGVAEDPSLPLGALPLLSEAERRQIVEEWNQTTTEYPRDLPEASAVIGPDRGQVLFEAPQLRLPFAQERLWLISRRSELDPERLALLRKWVGARPAEESAEPAPAAPDLPADLSADLSATGGEISPLVEIRPVIEGSRPPLFFVHPANGHANSYLALGRHLAPDLPLYVLQSPGLTGGCLYTGMEAVAAAYVDALRSVRPRGPYRLGGWSVGGTFAYEMARRLRAGGEEVELLVLVDSHAPEPEHLAPHEEAVLLASLAREIAGAAGKSLDLPLDELRRIPSQERLGWVVDTARKLEILPASFSSEEARRYWDVYRSNVRAVETYRAERQPLRAVLFRATRQLHEAEGKPSLGWARWITGRLDVAAVEGDHYDVIREPAVEVVARGISERLAPAPAAATVS